MTKVQIEKTDYEVLVRAAKARNMTLKEEVYAGDLSEDDRDAKMEIIRHYRNAIGRSIREVKYQVDGELEI